MARMRLESWSLVSVSEHGVTAKVRHCRLAGPVLRGAPGRRMAQNPMASFRAQNGIQDSSMNLRRQTVPDFLPKRGTERSCRKWPARKPTATCQTVRRKPRSINIATTQERTRQVSWRSLPKDFLHDQKDIWWIFPSQLARGQHWMPTLAITGGTAGTDRGRSPHHAVLSYPCAETWTTSTMFLIL